MVPVKVISAQRLGQPWVRKWGVCMQCYLLLSFSFTDQVKIHRRGNKLNHLIQGESVAMRLSTDSGSSQDGEGEEWSCPLSRRVRARGLRLLSGRESNWVPWSSQPCLKMMEADRSGINLKVSALWAPSGNSPGNHSAGAWRDESTKWNGGRWRHAWVR